MLKCKKVKTESRHFYIDKAFWIVMKESDKHPYFVAYINNVG